MNKTVKDADNALEWNVKQEMLLFLSMMGRKPVGINRHFMMAVIHEKFSKLLNKQISSEPIWEHLDIMYDMEALHESEMIPFPDEEIDFELSEDFDELAIQRLGVPLLHSGKCDDASTNFLNSGKKSGSMRIKKTPRKMSTSSSSSSSSGSSYATSSSKKNVISKLQGNNEIQMPTKEKTEPSSASKNVKGRQSSVSEVKLTKQGMPFDSQIKTAKREASAALKNVTKDGNFKSVKSANEGKERNSSLKKVEQIIGREKSGSRRSSSASEDMPIKKSKASSERVTRTPSHEKSGSRRSSSASEDMSLKKSKGSSERVMRTSSCEKTGSRRSSSASEDMPIHKLKGSSEKVTRKSSHEKSGSRRGSSASEDMPINKLKGSSEKVTHILSHEKSGSRRSSSASEDMPIKKWKGSFENNISAKEKDHNYKSESELPNLMSLQHGSEKNTSVLEMHHGNLVIRRPHISGNTGSAKISRRLSDDLLDSTKKRKHVISKKTDSDSKLETMIGS